MFKQARLKFWIVILELLLRIPSREFKIKKLKLILKVQKKELEAFEACFGYNPLTMREAQS